MAKTSKKKKKTEPRQSQQKVDLPAAAPAAHSGVRETIESIVIAFVLAFLFRTFEAEAFVIPTGSMAHTLRGAHKDVECPKCGFRYQASASDEAEHFTSSWKAKLADMEAKLKKNEKELATAKTEFERARLKRARNVLETEWRELRQRDIVSITCPMCRYTMDVDPEPGIDRPDDAEGRLGAEQPTYNGDRILVSKFAYEFEEPHRWDVIVFKFPGGASTNYIKRLVGLPGETIRIQQGDIFTVDDDGQPQIARKPPSKVRAIASPVYDNHYQPRELIDAGWPYRWQPWPPGQSAAADGWQVTTAGDDRNSWQVFQSEDRGDKTDWIRYQHLVPGADDWQQIREGCLPSSRLDTLRPQLITDFYAYNTHVIRLENDKIGADHSAQRLGLHWVGDLMLETDVQVESNAGELLLDLVEGGRHFAATIDVASGKATLAIQGVADFAPTAQTDLRGPGSYTVAFANVDDQLLLWIDDSLVTFDKPTTYERKQVFGPGNRIVPQSTDEDAGDLAPAGVGSRGARLSVDHLRLYRDIYYIADSNTNEIPGKQQPLTDYDRNGEPYRNLSVAELERFLSHPELWPATFNDTRSVEFVTGPDEFFVLGDNSPYSADGRLWPGGHTVPRKLLIGKALYIYWPHSWGTIPYAPQWLPGWPAFGDMGLVR